LPLFSLFRLACFSVFIICLRKNKLCILDHIDLNTYTQNSTFIGNADEVIFVINHKSFGGSVDWATESLRKHMHLRNILEGRTGVKMGSNRTTDSNKHGN